jgi:LPXTG-motif cell wall-anchored protein
MGFFESGWFLALMAILLVALIILFIYLRKQRREED